MFPIRKPARRTVIQQCGKHEKRRRGEARRVGQHYRFECAVQLEHRRHPEDAHAAHAKRRQHGRDKRNAKAAQITGHDLIQNSERIRGEHYPQPHAADGNDLRLAVEHGHEPFPGEQQRRRNGRSGQEILRQRQEKRLFAARCLPRAVILADEGRARLRKGIQYIVVTGAASFDFIKNFIKVPVSRNEFYEKYRKFFWLLSKKR